jgi:NitT/TauT family transport system substrate-binding protein
MNRKKMKIQLSMFWCIIAGSLLWFVVISLLHYRFNYEHEKRKVITMGYMPVITNLAAPLLDHVSNDSGEVYFKALKFNSFAEMAEALRNDEIQVAFIIAPLAIVLRQQGEDVKVVCIGNRHESSLVTRKALNISTLADLKGKTVAVPMRYSGHNISLLKLMNENGLNGQVNIVEMNPPDMASAMISGSLDAYFVGEPFATQSLKNGSATLLFHVEDVWDSFICNLVLVNQRFIDNDPRIVKMLVEGAARSCLWAENHPIQAAKIASDYWNQPLELVEDVLTDPTRHIVYDRYVPQLEEMQEIADLMVQFDLTDNNRIFGLVDDRFAKSVSRETILDLEDILPPSSALTSWHDEYIK